MVHTDPLKRVQPARLTRNRFESRKPHWGILISVHRCARAFCVQLAALTAFSRATSPLRAHHSPRGLSLLEHERGRGSAESHEINRRADLREQVDRRRFARWGRIRIPIQPQLPAKRKGIARRLDPPSGSGGDVLGCYPAQSARSTTQDTHRQARAVGNTQDARCQALIETDLRARLATLQRESDDPIPAMVRG